MQKENEQLISSSSQNKINSPKMYIAHLFVLCLNKEIHRRMLNCIINRRKNEGISVLYFDDLPHRGTR